MATTLALLAAGKHVFCEKPLAPNHSDAFAMTEAAETGGLVNMVNLTYRNAPALQKARAMVEAGELGALRHVEASYRQSWLVSKAWGNWATEDKWLWRLSTKHGSTGVLGDVGVPHPRLRDVWRGRRDRAVPGRSGDSSTRPRTIRIGNYQLDANDSMAATARLSSGALATIVATRFATGHANDLTLSLHGTKGALRVETDGKVSKLSGCFSKDIDRNRWKKIETPPVKRNALGALLTRWRAAGTATRPSGAPPTRSKVIDAIFESAKSGKPVAVR